MLPAIDFEGSGALQYLRPEIIHPPAIHSSLSNLPQYVAQANAVILSHVLVLTNLPPHTEFDARANLLQVRENIRATNALISSDDVLAATESLRRLHARENESVEDWAEKLSRDVSAHRD
jgi:hypothetical protein